MRKHPESGPDLSSKSRVLASRFSALGHSCDLSDSAPSLRPVRRPRDCSADYTLRRLSRPSTRSSRLTLRVTAPHARQLSPAHPHSPFTPPTNAALTGPASPTRFVLADLATLFGLGPFSGDPQSSPLVSTSASPHPLVSNTTPPPPPPPRLASSLLPGLRTFCRSLPHSLAGCNGTHSPFLNQLRYILPRRLTPTTSPPRLSLYPLSSHISSHLPTPLAAPVTINGPACSTHTTSLNNGRHPRLV